MRRNRRWRKQTPRESLKDLLELVSGDLDFVTVRVVEIDGVRNLVILKIEWNRAFFQLILRMQKILAIGAKSKMKGSHRGTIVGHRADFLARGK